MSQEYGTGMQVQQISTSTQRYIPYLLVMDLIVTWLEREKNITKKKGLQFRDEKAQSISFLASQSQKNDVGRDVMALDFCCSLSVYFPAHFAERRSSLHKKFQVICIFQEYQYSIMLCVACSVNLFQRISPVFRAIVKLSFCRQFTSYSFPHAKNMRENFCTFGKSPTFIKNRRPEM